MSMFLFNVANNLLTSPVVSLCSPHARCPTFARSPIELIPLQPLRFTSLPCVCPCAARQHHSDDLGFEVCALPAELDACRLLATRSSCPCSCTLCDSCLCVLPATTSCKLQHHLWSRCSAVEFELRRSAGHGNAQPRRNSESAGQTQRQQTHVAGTLAVATLLSHSFACPHGFSSNHRVGPRFGFACRTRRDSTAGTSAHSSPRAVVYSVSVPHCSVHVCTAHHCDSREWRVQRL